MARKSIVRRLAAIAIPAAFIVSACGGASVPPAPLASPVPSVVAPSVTPETSGPMSTPTPVPTSSVAPMNDPAGTPVPLSSDLAVYAPAPAPTTCRADRLYKLPATMSKVAAFTINATSTLPGGPVQLRLEWVGPSAFRDQMVSDTGSVRGAFIVGTNAWVGHPGAWSYMGTEEKAFDYLATFFGTYVVGTQPGLRDGKVVGDACSYDVVGDGSDLVVLDGGGRLLTVTGAMHHLSVDYATVPNLVPPTGD